MISYKIVDENRLKSGSSSNMIKDSDKEDCHNIANDKDVVDKLVRSFAPSIHGHSAIKKGILAQLFGGTKKILDNRHNAKGGAN
jgi:DNA replicative helicase MCM subunit Mcm2 (Cdc46/Mcm family)